MQIQALHADFKLPTRGSDQCGGYDLYMPEPGMTNGMCQLVGLGFAAAVPRGKVALILPRSSTGAKYGLELNNSVGLIDPDYRGEWLAALRTKSGEPLTWKAGDRLLQFILVPTYSVDLELVGALDATHRGAGGFGSTGI